MHGLLSLEFAAALATPEVMLVVIMLNNRQLHVAIRSGTLKKT